jgi:hypothetical protein
VRGRFAAVECWLPPLWVGAVALALLFAAALATGHDPLHTATWARYDSAHYQEIARHGYEVHRCGVGEHRAKWCGDTAWFPGYPILVAAVAATGVPLAVGAIAISWLGSAATLVLLWRWFLPRRGAVLVCAAFAPGLVYLYALFPLSLLTLAGVVFVRHLERRPLLAGAAGAVAALAYPLGIALVPLVAVVSAIQHRREGRHVARLAALVGPAAAAGIAIVVEQRLQTGRWTAYADVAGGYGGLHNPVTSITDLVTILVDASNPFAYALAPIWQFVVVLVLVVVAAVAAIRRRRCAPLVVWCLGATFLPLLQTGQSVWRSEAALVLLAPLLAPLPRRVVAIAAAALVVLAYGVAHEYFAGTLI